jgi:V8-like Glu-specific endopeptidase
MAVAATTVLLHCGTKATKPPAPSCGDERETVPATGEASTLREAIIEGTDSFDPQVVQLRPGQVLAIGALIREFPEIGWLNYCTAALVAPRLVLTAGHCLYTDPDGGTLLEPGDLRFALGPDALTTTDFLIPQEIHHPAEYEHTNLLSSHDVGVLVLEEPATDLYPRLEAIPVNCQGLSQADFVGQRTQHVGFGQTHPHDWEPWNSQRHWTVEEVTNLFTDEFIVWGRRETGVCWGDSGSPALWTTADGTVRVVGVHARADESCTEFADFSLVNGNCDFLRQFLAPCGELTLAGRCRNDGEIAEFCQGETVQFVNCASWGQRCALDDESQSRCIDQCADESWLGRCDETTAVWCDEQQVRRDDCAAVGQACGPDEMGANRCRDDPCQGTNEQGRCQGGQAQWCQDGSLRERDCAACGQRCDWSAEFNAHYCVD